MQENKELQGTAVALKDMALAIEIHCPEDYELAAGGGKQVAGAEKRIKAFFDPMRKAAKASYDEVLAQQKTYLAPLGAAKAVLRQKMVAWDQEQERKRRAMEVKVKEESGTVVDIPKPKAPEGVQRRQNWQWKLVDVTLLPDAYKMPNEQMITAEVKKNKDKTQIPGVEVYDAGTIAFRS